MQQNTVIVTLRPGTLYLDVRYFLRTFGKVAPNTRCIARNASNLTFTFLYPSGEYCIPVHQNFIDAEPTVAEWTLGVLEVDDAYQVTASAKGCLGDQVIVYGCDKAVEAAKALIGNGVPGGTMDQMVDEITVKELFTDFQVIRLRADAHW